MRWIWPLLLLACAGPGAPSAAPPDRVATHARGVHAAFRAEAALDTVRYVDRFFRVRGNEGYQKTLERVETELRRGGLEAVRRIQLGPARPTWTPRSARLALNGRALIAFEDETGVDRAALLVGSEPFRGELEVVHADAVRRGADARGKLILGVGSPRALYAELVEPNGAAGLLVRNLEPYHQPERYPESAQFGYVPGGIGFSLSDADYRALAAVTDARVEVEIEVAVGESRATAVEARIPGTDPTAGAIVRFMRCPSSPVGDADVRGVRWWRQLENRAGRRGGGPSCRARR